ncbi:SH3 domain-containing protein [Gehongia tenuis]|uniref:SH3 domain-containing protein n=1 Tax=Gehongia tenuis TaxID=2763655 RepID=A0A926D6L6_9FIRM|nr:SH3 domain-containing protein [Gehongia tenuis]MBC8532344.1 SH3 domain-containing protein [Gehongia tenuis]
MGLKKRSLAVALVVAMVFTLFAPLSATTAKAEGGTYRVTASALNVRSGPSTGTSVIGTLTRGREVAVSSISGSWGAISYNGRTGYIHMDYVTSVGSGSSSAPSGSTGVVKASVLNVRSGPSTGYSKIGSLTRNTTVSVLEQSGGWYKISYGSLTGYVSGEYLTISGGSSTPSTPTDPGTVIGTGTVTASALNVRSGPSTGYGVMGTLRKGAAVSVYEQMGGWYKIAYNGGVGYVSGDYLSYSASGGGSTTPPTPTTPDIIGTGTVTASALNVRSGPSTGYRVMGTLRKGAKVSVYDGANGWYKIDYNGSIGYVSGDYLSYSPNGGGSTTPENPNPGEGIGTGVVTAVVLNVRSGAGTGYSKIGSLNKNTAITVTQVLSGWYKIIFNGGVGYVSADYVNYTPNSTGGGSDPELPETGSSTIGSSSRLAGKVIFLDAGHGGSSSGAVYGGVYEKNVNRDITAKVKAALERSGATVIMIREGDSTVDLYPRMSIVNRASLQALLPGRNEKLAALNTQKTPLAEEVEALQAKADQLTDSATAVRVLNQAVAGNADYQRAIDGAVGEMDGLFEVLNGAVTPSSPSASPVSPDNGNSPSSSPSNSPSDNASPSASPSTSPSGDNGSDASPSPSPSATASPLGTPEANPVAYRSSGIQLARLAGTSDSALVTALKEKADEAMALYGLPNALKDTAAYKALYAEAVLDAAKADSRVDNALLTEFEAKVKAMKDTVTAPFTLEVAKNPSGALAEIMVQLTPKKEELTKLDDEITKLTEEIADMNRIIGEYTAHLSGQRTDSQIYGGYTKAILPDLAKTFEWQRELESNYMFVSIHSNAMANGGTTASGTEIYYVSSGTEYASSYFSAYNDSARIRLANLLLDQVSSTMGTNRRYINNGTSLCVLREQNLPSALVEVGYLSNPSDRSKLVNEAYQHKAADGVVKAIFQYYGV